MIATVRPPTSLHPIEAGGRALDINRTQRHYREQGPTVRKRRARAAASWNPYPDPGRGKGKARRQLDFVRDQFGRHFRILDVVDGVTRECLAASPDPGDLEQARLPRTD